MKRGEMTSILLSADCDCRVRSVQSVASHSLLALWLPCVTHGSSMLHSLLPSVCLFVSLLIPSLSQPHSLPSSCLPLSFCPPQAWILPLLSLLFPSLMSCLYFFFLHPSVSFLLSDPPTLLLPVSLAHFSFYTLMDSTLRLHLLKLIFGQKLLAVITELLSSHRDKEVYLVIIQEPIWGHLVLYS